MDVTVTQKDLTAILARVRPWTRDPAAPVAVVCLDSGTAGQLRARAWNGYAGAEASADTLPPAGRLVTGPGQVLLRADLLADMIKAVPAGEAIRIAWDGDGKVKITGGSSRYQDTPYPDAAVPELPPLPAAAGKADGAQLAAALRAVLPSVDPNHATRVLQAVRIEADPAGVLRITGCDRYRVHQASIPWDPAISAARVAHLSRDVCAEAARHACAGPVTLHLGPDPANGVAGVAWDRGTIAAAVIGADYPDVSGHLRPGAAVPAVTAVVPGLPLAAALDRVEVVTDKAAPNARCEFGGGMLRLAASGSGGHSAAEEEMAAGLAWPGGAGDGRFRIAFKASYLADAVRHGGETAEIAMTRPAERALITSRIGGVTVNVTLMPVAIDWPDDTDSA
jgi:DNA polymerase III sliding clamp (beta) subunit (PCNA family)